VLLAALVAWSSPEVGLDWWPLAARMDVAFVFGVRLLLPWFARPLAGPRSHWAVLGAAVAVSAVLADVAGTRNPHDIDDDLPQTASAAAPVASDVPEGEWHAYGRTATGQRLSPLAQITPPNVADLQVALQFRSGDVRGRPAIRRRPRTKRRRSRSAAACTSARRASRTSPPPTSRPLPRRPRASPPPAARSPSPPTTPRPAPTAPRSCSSPRPTAA
jgi:hypothetical protein